MGVTKTTTRDVSRLIDELKQEGVEGIVMDLRNNGGGSLEEAKTLTGLFIESGPGGAGAQPGAARPAVPGYGFTH